jgi:hypothetical protein
LNRIEAVRNWEKIAKEILFSSTNLPKNGPDGDKMGPSSEKSERRKPDPFI